MSWERVMEEFLNMAQEKEKNSHSQPATEKSTAPTQGKNIASPAVPAKRSIPAAIRHELEKQYEGVCGFPNCNKPSIIFHHTKRFALDPHHDSETIVPLCKAHERIGHASLIGNEEQAPTHWKVLAVPDRSHPKYAIDQIVQNMRMVRMVT